MFFNFNFNFDCRLLSRDYLIYKGYLSFQGL